MSRESHLVGSVFGRLTVLEFSPKKGRSAWLCRCLCGKQKVVANHHLRSGATRSCGCLSKEVTTKRCTTHGMAARGRRRSSEYSIWHGIITRCNNPKVKLFRFYGALGIKVCPRWESSFEAFLSIYSEQPVRAPVSGLLYVSSPLHVPGFVIA